MTCATGRQKVQWRSFRCANRVVQHSNWKFFMENQLDALHPSVTHQSTGIAAGRVERALREEGQTPPLYYHYLSTFASSFEQWDSVQTVNFPRGHGILKGYMGLRPDDPDTKEYVAAMYKAYGEKQAEAYLGRSIHQRAGLIRTSPCTLPCSSCGCCVPWRPTKLSRRSGTSG